jgi:hypothetical protein
MNDYYSIGEINKKLKNLVLMTGISPIFLTLIALFLILIQFDEWGIFIFAIAFGVLVNTAFSLNNIRKRLKMIQQKHDSHPRHDKML